MDDGYQAYQCWTCGFVYDEADGMPMDGIPPGTRWSSLPDDWICPSCGTPKGEFDPIDF